MTFTTADTHTIHAFSWIIRHSIFRVATQPGVWESRSEHGGLDGGLMLYQGDGQWLTMSLA